jgi:hypothetical protein
LTFRQSPLSLSQQSHVIKLIADITGGSNRTAQLSIQRSSDAMFIDSQLGQPVTPTKNGSAFAAVTSGGAITIASVSGSSGVSVTLDPSSPTSNIAVGATNVKLASYDFLATGESVKINDLYVEADTSAHNGGLANGKIYVNGSQIGSTKNIAEGTGGTQTGTDFSLGSSLILPAGQTVKIDIYGDAKTSTSTNLVNNETVKIYLDAGSSNGQGQSSLNSVNAPAASTGGNTITVASSALTAAKYSGYGNQTIIAGSNNAKLGSFTLSSGSTEGVTVNTIVLTMSAANAASITNLTLKDTATGTTVGQVQTTPSTSNSYSINIDIAAGQSKTFDVYGNVLAGVNVGPMILTVDTTTTGTGDITGTSASVGTAATLQTVTVGTASLAVTNGAGNPTNAMAVAGASQVKVGQFKFSAQSSDYTIDSLAILVPAGAASAVKDVMLSFDGGALTPAPHGFAANSSGTQPYATATFSGLSFRVPANTSKNLDVYVSIPTIANTGTTGAAISVRLDNTSNAFNGIGFHALDSSGTAKTSLTSAINSTDVSGQGTVVVRQSIPTFSSVSLASNSLPAGNGVTLAQMKIASDVAGDTSWDKISFTISKSSAVLIGATSSVTLWTSSTGSSWTQVAGTFGTTTGSLLGGLDAFGAGAFASGGNLTFIPTAEQIVPAGSSAQYQLRGNVSGLTSGSNFVSVSVANPSSTVITDKASVVGVTNAASPSVTWSDLAATALAATHSTTSTDWTSDYLIPGLVLNFPTLTTNI